MNATAADVLNALAKEAHECALEKGWYERPRDLPEVLMLMVSELAEALEAARIGNPPSKKIPPHSCIAEELADCLIRLLDTAHKEGLDIGNAVLAKMRFNWTRPVRHGGKVY